MVSKKYATSSSIALFVIVSLTGVLLFFHQGGMSAKVIHEWLGIGFIIAGALHVMANWRPFTKYFKGAKGIILGLFIMVPVGLMLFSPSNEGSPMKGVMQKVLNSPLDKVAVFYEKSPDSLKQDFEKMGYKIQSLEDSILKISKTNGKSPMEIVSLLVKSSNID